MQEKKYNRSLILLVLMLAAMAGALMQTSLGTALPTLMHAFNINLSTAQQATTWFLLVNGAMVPVSAFLANRFSTKWLHVVAYGLLLIGILISMLTPEKGNLWWIFVVGRIVAAVAVGIILPLMQIVILNMYSPKERAFAMGMMGLVVGMAPAFGPTLTGWILNKSHHILGFTLSNAWQNIFIIPLIFIALATVLAPFLLKDVVENTKQKLDITSFILSVAGFGLFIWGFTNVSSQGWGDFKEVILPILIGVLFLVVFVVKQLRMKVPFLDVRVFMNKDFTIPTISLLLATMAMYGIEMVLPTYLQNVRGLTPLDSGLTLLYGALFMGIMSPIAGALYNKVGIKLLSIVGFLLLILGTLPFVFINAETPTIIITVLYAIRMMGIATVMMPLTTAAMDSLPTKKGADGTAANNTLRQVSSSIVVAILTSVIQNIANNNAPAKSLAHTDPLRYADKALDASIYGFRVVFIISLAFAVVGLFFVLISRNNKKEVTK
ncbi:multidrug MFS-type transporter [Apilactobacillus kunkeei]|uniref:MDR family MFS transporter n=1 Tax=Apilactobacillus kunkeei TaxID=148814 RepID=UPI0006C5E2D5|nr:MDR family MFS transporter [Apilactobacillus kunkeei]KOY74906.1 multidrug MFS-type transporter [Apilactobacillus kunkeei]